MKDISKEKGGQQNCLAIILTNRMCIAKSETAICANHFLYVESAFHVPFLEQLQNDEGPDLLVASSHCREGSKLGYTKRNAGNGKNQTELKFVTKIELHIIKTV